MTGVGPVRDDTGSADLQTALPDWQHDPRELADSVRRRASRRRRSRIGAAVAAVLLVVAGGWYLGFVTGWVAIPGLGTLTSHRAGVSSFTVGEVTYLMQVEASDDSTVGVSKVVGTGRSELLGTLPVPGPDPSSVTVLRLPLNGFDAVRMTYATLLPAGAHDVLATPSDPQLSETVQEGVVRSSPSSPPLLGVVVTLDPPSGTPASLSRPGLASIRWTDADGHQHVTPVET